MKKNTNASMTDIACNKTAIVRYWYYSIERFIHTNESVTYLQVITQSNAEFMSSLYQYKNEQSGNL